jgi:prepilin-type N-terminal cleavage/methylation domain-containing protein
MPGSRPHPTRPARATAAPGFTLVELLTVIVIISILMAITMTVSKGIQTRQTMTKATSEMSALCAALDQFKTKYGEYPPADNTQGSYSPYAEQNLVLALTGRARWTHYAQGALKWEYVTMDHQLNDSSVPPGSTSKYTWGIAFIDAAKYTIDQDSGSPSGYNAQGIIHDPWWDGLLADNGYLYRYKTTADILNPATRAWQAVGFLLVSRGPDQQPQDGNSNFDGHWKAVNGQPQNTGILDPAYSDPNTNPQLADNIIMGTAATP